MWKLTHSCKGFIKEECMYSIRLEYEAMEQYILQFGGKRNVYYLGMIFKGEIALREALKWQ